MSAQVPLGPEARAREREAGGLHEVAPDLAYRRLLFVNVALVGRPAAGDRGWVLVDAGLPGTKAWIVEAAASRFGVGARPSAIVLTHGHFDHVGALEDLAAEWDCPVYGHALERPYLDGSAAYPPGDPSVGGGLMASLAGLYPTRPVDVRDRLRTLPEDGSVPGMPGWRWLHTPGHSAGHVSLWRERDGTLIAGDAVVTTRAESAYASALQPPEMHGPPAYFTTDWAKARGSVELLAELRPNLAITGHGRAMGGAAMTDALEELARDFDRRAVPPCGRYRARPALAEDGSAYRSPGPAARPARPLLIGLVGAGAALGLTALLNAWLARRAEAENPPAGRFVEVDGVRLHYLERGTGKPLVLLHGNGSMVQDFTSSGLVERAAERYRVIVFDRPGYGHSERPRGTVWTDEAQAELIGAALRELGVASAIVLGHSWGCSVAVALARTDPETVAGLVLASGYFYPSARVDVAVASAPAIPVIGDVLRYTLSPILARLTWPLMLRRLFAPSPVPAKFDGFPKEMSFRPSQIRTAAAESALMIPDAVAARAHYAEITMPVAIVAGEEDGLVDIEDQSARLHDELPHSTLRRVPGVGHMVHQSATAEVFAAIEEVADRVGRLRGVAPPRFRSG